jgi:hypothetical protein
MTPESVGPFSRPFLVVRLPAEGTRVDIEATREECDALAADLGLPGIRSLAAQFRLTAIGATVRVRGRVAADIVQTCVVSLEPFESNLDEEVEVDFAEIAADSRRREPGAEIDLADEGPDEIVEGRIDLGSLAAEFLALGLDPHPRKPGVDFDYKDAEGSGNAFAELARLKPPEA